jgi:caa(3)-type oxidase subunit IV
MLLLNKPASRVWLLLMGLTCITTWGLSKDDFVPAMATIVTVWLAALKARLVILHFMELRDAPPAWRLLFEAWTVVVAAAITGIYLATPPLH